MNNNDMFDLEETYLYHYTTFECAVKIIASKQLRFSPSSRLNDINEQSGPIVFSTDQESDIIIQKIISEYTQISFSVDKERKGFDIPLMWGHYASKGKGVCLYFDKAQLDKDATSNGLYATNVYYSNEDNLYERLYQKGGNVTIKEYLDRSKDYLFFRKSLDWEHEQECRLIPIDGNPSVLDISSSLKGVILYNRSHQDFLDSIEYLSLRKLDEGLEFYRYSSSLGSWNLYNVSGDSIRKPLTFQLPSIKESEE